tara:strand:- start:60 stop:365 length:306 start_codon:yes stop_codon:yes gene_type:complete
MLSWIRNNHLYFFGYFAIFLFIFFFIFSSTIGNKSIFSLLEINEKIDVLKKDLLILEKKEIYLYSKIKMLKNNELDPDYISELAQKKLGLIKPDRVVVKIN